MPTRFLGYPVSPMQAAVYTNVLGRDNNRIGRRVDLDIDRGLGMRIR